MSRNKSATVSEDTQVGTSRREDWVRDLSASQSLLEEIALPSPSLRVGRVVGLSATGFPLVNFPGNPDSASISARHTCLISKADVGREAVLVFESNDLSQPIVLGLLQPGPQPRPEPVNVTVDGKQVTVSAENEIVLRCGKASITLTRAGKVLINGEYLLSRSNGVNRIKGGSVQIN